MGNIIGKYMKLGKVVCFVFCLTIASNASAGNDASADEMDAVAVKLKAGDFSLVPTKLTELAKAGDARAEFNLGVSYYYGNGVKQDYAEALKWYQKAAEHGNERAQYNLASLYADGLGTTRDAAKAAQWYAKAAEKGDVASHLALARIYSYGGNNLQPDYAKAYKYYEEASLKGSDEAEFNVGGMCLFGAGTEQNVPKAVEIYTKLAANGNERASLILGEIYESGKYTAQDLPRSYAWYSRAFETTGNKDAKNRAAEIRKFINEQQFAEAQKIEDELRLTESKIAGNITQ